MLMRRSWERPRERDWAEVLGALPLFARFRKRQLLGLAKHAEVADYSPGEVIVQKGDRRLARNQGREPEIACRSACVSPARPSSTNAENGSSGGFGYGPGWIRTNGQRIMSPLL
jgi:hypothetical protein